MLTRFSASRLRSPSGRRIRRATRARLSPPRLNYTTIFVYCTPAWAGPIAPSAANSYSATPSIMSPRGCWPSPSGSRFYVLFPIPAGLDTQHLRDRLFELRGKGFNRLYQGGRIFEFSTPESLLDIDFKKPVHILVDRLAIDPDQHQRIVDSVEIAYRESGEVLFERTGEAGAEVLRFSEKFACKKDNIAFAVPEPALFSFNSPVGACPRCQGFGRTIDYDMDLVIPDTQSVDRRRRRRSLGQARPRMGYCLLQEGVQRQAPLQRAGLRPQEGRTRRSLNEAINDFFAEVEGKKYKVQVRVFLSRYRGYARCPDCGGSRLRKEALYVRVAGKNMAELVAAELRRGLGLLRRSRAVTRGNCDRRQDPGRSTAAPEIPERCRSPLPDARPPVDDTCRAARRSASSWRRVSGPVWSVPAMSLTNRPSACTRAIPDGWSGSCMNCAISATRSSLSSTTPT